MGEHRLTELDSGLRIVTEAMSSVRSVALGYWVGSGSRTESDEQAGLAHLLEHMLFRGAGEFSSLQIDQIFDAMGAELNAGTDKESTSIYSRVIDSHLPRAVEVMSELVWRPAYEDADIERDVILEEIAMYEDDPAAKVFDVLGGAIFGKHPLGRAILGRPEVISDTPLDEIRAFHEARYVPGNVVVSAAGAVDHDALVEQVAAAAGERSGSFVAETATPAAVAPRPRFETKDTEQYHVCLGATGLGHGDPRRFALRVLENLFGVSYSSRLVQEVREQRGLAYSIYAFSEPYAGSGQVGIYLGTREDNLATAIEIVARELHRVEEEPVSADELTRAKEDLKARTIMSQESPGARMGRLGASVLAEVDLLSVEDVVAAIDAVSVDEVGELAGELFAVDRLVAAGVGPDADVFEAALEPLTAGKPVAVTPHPMAGHR